MKEKNNNQYKIIAYVIGTIAFLFSSGRWNIPIMAWIWPFCMLYWTRKSNKPYGLIGTVISMIICSTIKWYGGAGGAVFDNILAGIGLGLLSWLPFLIDELTYKKLKGIKSTLVLPLAVASIEFLMQLTPIATVGSIAATQTGWNSFMQIASIVGSYGVSFLVIWFATACMSWIENKSKTIILLYFTIFMLSLVYGGARLAFADYKVGTIKVGVTTGPYIGDFLTGTDETISLEENITSMQDTIKTAAAGKADILVYCEEAFTIADTNKEIMLEKVKEAAKENNIVVLIAFEIEDTDNSQDGKSDNVEYLISYDGKIIWEYKKAHLTNFVETGTITKGNGVIPNETITLANGKQIKLASIICMDSDFPTYVREGLDNDTSILLIPTWDWDPIRAFHTKWVEIRAIENGVNLVRSCTDGVSTVTDVYGRVIMHSDTASSGYENVVFAEVPTNSVMTIYKLVGGVIDWIYVLGLIGLIGISIKNKRKAI